MSTKLFFIGSLLCFLSVFGQDSIDVGFTPTFSYGLRGGANMAYVPEVLDEIKKNDPRLGFFAGAFANYTISPKSALQLEVNYSQQGAQTLFLLRFPVTIDGNTIDLVTDADTNFKLDYINIPVLYRWNFYDNFYLGGGLQLGFLINNYMEISADTFYDENNPDFIINTELSFSGSVEEVRKEILETTGQDYAIETVSTDLSFIFDGGYAINSKFAINGRYSLGLTNVLKGEDLDSDPKNSVFSLGLQYTF